MKRTQENFVSMADAAIGVLDANEAVWTASVPMTNAVTDAKAARTAIGQGVQGQQASSEGATIDKEELADDASDIAAKIATLVQGYALDEDDDTLYEQLRRYSRGRLENVPDAELGDVLRDLHARVSAITAADLVPYDVTAGMLTELMAAIVAYEDLPQNPRQIIAGRKVHTDSIPGNIAKLRAALVRVDKLIVRYEESEPEFVGAYRNARIVIDLKGSAGTGGD